MGAIVNGSMMRVHSNILQAEGQLFSAMSRASSGKRIQKPGDAPVDFGISESFRYQIRNSEQAKRNVDEARARIMTADAWLQTVDDILIRMGELAITASDGSKSDEDRGNLVREFNSLKEEIGRIARDARYNTMQVAGQDELMFYDPTEKGFRFSQLDGTNDYMMEQVFLSGVQTSNGIDTFFDATKSYSMNGEGDTIFFVDGNDHLVRYQIETGTAARDSADSETKQLSVDEKGRLWYAAETTTGSGVYGLRQQDITAWVQDTTLIGSSDIADMGSTEFKVYEDRVFYVDTTGNMVSRSLRNPGDVDVEIKSAEFAFTVADGQFAISHDGNYIADMTASNVVRITNVKSLEAASYTFQSGVSLSDLQFSADNREIVVHEQTSNTIRSVELVAAHSPELSQERILYSGDIEGVSLGGGSSRSQFRVHNGPDSGQYSFVTGADVRLYTLGIANVAVDTAEEAQKSIKRLQTAIDRVTVQRSSLGASEMRLEFAYNALSEYKNGIEMADSVLRDSDLAEETSIIAQQQVIYQAGLAMLAQQQQRGQAILSLLQG